MNSSWDPLCQNTRRPSQPSAGVLTTQTCLLQPLQTTCSSYGTWQSKKLWQDWTTLKVDGQSTPGFIGPVELAFDCCALSSPGNLWCLLCFPGVPTSVSWCLNSSDGVAFVSQRGPLYIWVYGGPDPGVTVHKEAHSFLSDICLFRWHPNKKGKLVFGHTDGSLSIFQPGMDMFFNSAQTNKLLCDTYTCLKSAYSVIPSLISVCCLV